MCDLSDKSYWAVLVAVFSSILNYMFLYMIVRIFVILLIYICLIYVNADRQFIPVDLPITDWSFRINKVFFFFFTLLLLSCGTVYYAVQGGSTWWF